jgi:hypothetical protein
MTPGDSSSQKLRSELKSWVCISIDAFGFCFPLFFCSHLYLHDWCCTGYVVTKRTKLTYKQKRKIKERLQAINPDITIFVSLVHKNRSHLVNFVFLLV